MIECPICGDQVAVQVDGSLALHERVIEMPGWCGPPKTPRLCLGSGMLADNIGWNEDE